MAQATPTEDLPSIAYVDESADARADFLTDARRFGLFREVQLLKPEPTLPEMVRALLELRVDAVVSDFQLTAEYPVDYDGETLVEAVRAVRAGFPCFIQTSFYDKAIHQVDDVNRVYSKDEAAGTGNREEFFNRVSVQIQRHNARVKKWEDELQELLSIKREKLTASEIERILELDKHLEENLGTDETVSQAAKRDLLKDENLGKRHMELIEAAEQLVQKMRNALDD